MKRHTLKTEAEEVFYDNDFMQQIKVATDIKNGRINIAKIKKAPQISRDFN